MDPDAAELVLHRYFLRADRMRLDFRDSLLTHGIDPSQPLRYARTTTYMSLWYTLLAVVAEAWQDLKFRDPEVDDLLTSPNLDLLRRHRNAVAHYQPGYVSEKEAQILAEVTAQDWIEALHKAIGRYLLDWLQANSSRPLPTRGYRTEKEGDEALSAWFDEQLRAMRDVTGPGPGGNEQS